jgi:hypothetical protein
MATLRIAFLHLAPCLRDRQAHRRRIDRRGVELVVGVL